MATLQKFKLLDEQEQQYNRTGKIDEAAIRNAGITQLDYQQYEASKREYEKAGLVDFTKYTSDPTKGIYGGVDINQFDKDALALMRTVWKDTYTTSADKGKAYDMTDPDDVQNMLSGRMSKAVSSSYDIDEMSQWLYREGLPNSQNFGAMYNAALEEVAEQRRLTDNDKAFDSAVMNTLMEQSKAGAIIDEKAVRQAMIDVRATDPEKYDEVEERLYKETGLVASKAEGFLSEAQGMNAQMEEAAQSGREGGFLRNALLDAGAMLAGTPFASLAFTPPESEEEPERPLTEVDLKAQEIVGPFKLPEFEPIPFNVKEASPEEKRQAAEAKERRELERNGRSEAEINAHIASLSEEDWARRIGRMEASGYGDENVFKAQQEDAYREKKQEAAQGAYDALRAAGFSASEASIYLEQNGLDYADTAVYREAETARRASQDEGSTYLKQRAAEDGMENAGKDLHSYVSPDWSDMAASRREKEVVWAQAMRQELIDKGYSPLEADNILAVNNLDVALDKRQTAEDYERYILSVYGLDDASINDYITNLTDEEWEQRIKSLKFNDMLETGSYEQAERMLYSIPVRAALGVATGVVGVADMAANGIEALITGEDQDMWKSTKYLLEQSGKWAAYGHDINHPVMSAASDIGSEILRMYALGAAGGALGGLTGAGTSTLLSTVASQAPFVASSMGTYYTQARMSGANQGEATLFGVVGGTVEGLLESAATSEILNQAFTNKIMTKAITNAATPLKTRMLLAKYGTPLANIFASTIGEFGEEAASEVISGFLRTSIWDSSYETQLSDVGESGAMGAAIGFIMAALGAPATSRRNQIAMQMMDAQSGALPMDLQMFGEMYDNLVAATITESLKPETLTLVQKDAALQSAPTVADMIAQIQQDNAHISAEGVRHKRRLEALTEDVEKARSKVNRYVTAFKKLDPNSPDYATRWGELRGQIDSARDNFEQITASSLSKREAAAEEHAALVSRLQNDVARTSDKLTRHFVARNDAMVSEENLAKYRAQVDGAFTGQLTEGQPIQLGLTPRELVNLGANPLEMTMMQETARKIAYPEGYMGGKHNLGIPALKQLPQQIADPLAVVKSKSHGFIVLTEWNDINGNPVIIPVHLDKQGAISLENRVASAYGKENMDALLGPANENVLYTKNGEDIRQLLSSRLQLPSARADDVFPDGNTQFPGVGLQLPQTGSEDISFTDSIPQQQENVQSGAGNILDLGANTPTPVDLKESKLYTNTYDKILSEIEKAADSTDNSLYAVQHEVDTLAIARELVRGTMEREGNVDSLAAMLKKAEAWGPTDVDTAMMVLSAYRTEAADSGDFSKVNDWKGAIREHTTESAQALQAFAKWSRNTTEGALINAEQVIAKLNEEYKRDIEKGKISPFTIDEALTAELAKAGTQEERNAALDAIAQSIADQVPSSLADKITAWRYLSMLGNPRTHARNILGNVFMGGLRQAKDAVGTAIESVAIKDPSQRTKSILTGADRAFTDYAKSTWDDASVAFEGDKFDGSRKGLEKLVQDKRTIFNIKALEKARRFNLEALEWEDIALFAQPAYVDAYAKVMKARGLTGETITAPQRSEIMQLAADEALKVTFRDANKVADLLNKIERSGVAGKLLVAGTVPFKKTPLNVLKRGVEYSPVGLVKGIADSLIKVRSGKMTAAEAIDSISAGTVGTGLMAVGMLLTKTGILRASGEEDDKYEYYLRDMGEQPFSIKIGDTSFTVDWITPASMPLFMGAELYNAAVSDDGAGTALEGVISALAQTTDPIMQLSMLQGINDMLESIQSGEFGGALGSIASNAIYSYAGQFVPTLSGQIARTIDPVRRTTTGDPNAPWGKTLDKAGRKILAKIPFASSTNEPYINVRGEEEVDESGWMFRLAENMLLPGYVDKADMTDVDKEIVRIFSETDDPDVIPRNYPVRSLKRDGMEYTLSNDEYTQFKMDMGSSVYRALDDAMRNIKYDILTDEEKAKLLKKAISGAQETVRETYKDIYLG